MHSKDSTEEMFPSKDLPSVNGGNAAKGVSESSGFPIAWADEIQYLHELPQLPVDWDGFGAAPVSPEVVIATEKLLKSIYLSVKSTHNRELIAPEIDPIPNDGVYIQFKKRKSAFRLSVQRNTPKGAIDNRYFGKKGIIVVKGKLNSITLPSVVSFLDYFVV